MSLLRPLDPAFPFSGRSPSMSRRSCSSTSSRSTRPTRKSSSASGKDDAAFMKRQPGFISTQLHRAVGDSPTYLNYAVWESTAAFRAAFTDPEYAAKLSTYPSSAVAMPHLFQKVAVPDICIA